MHCELRKAGMGLFIRSLTVSELPKYLEHLLRLDATNRRMRFGVAIGDTGIREHLQRIDLRTDYILALFDDDLDVVAAAHIVRARDDDLAEFAFSVDRQWRSCGVGSELFNRTMLWARTEAFVGQSSLSLRESTTRRVDVTRSGRPASDSLSRTGKGVHDFLGPLQHVPRSGAATAGARPISAAARSGVTQQ